MVLWILFALTSAFFTAIATILMKISLRTSDPILTATVQASIANLFLIVTFLGSRGVVGFKFELPGIFYLVLAGIAGGLSWIFYAFALQHGAATQVATIERLNIVFIVIMCSFILGECWHIKYVFGALLVVLGAALITM